MNLVMEYTAAVSCVTVDSIIVIWPMHEIDHQGNVLLLDREAIPAYVGSHMRDMGIQPKLLETQS